jgi:hypothetical protein|tara:strand:+ start:67 stop:672 length:606 start_codon:yes stop_codon:yes gene_type:complete
MTFNKDWRISMRNSVGPIVVFMMVGLWGLVSAATAERSEQPRRTIATIDKREFPCSDKWWLFPLTRDRVFHSLGLTSDQRKEINRLNDQFKENKLDLKRRHNESLLNVLDDNQRQKLKEKKGEIDRYLEKIPRYRHCPKLRPIRDRPPANEEEFNRDDWPDHWRRGFPVDVGIREATANRNLMNSSVDPTTWGGVKKEFKE